MIRAMLDASKATGGILGSPQVDIQSALRVPAPQSEDGAVPGEIGRYTIVGILGRGGMGTVYEAVQDRPRRRVALKVLHEHLDAESAARRFAREAEILGCLNHPCIAQVYEFGIDSSGPTDRAYIAMELVGDARTLLAYANEQRLSPRERASLARRVCEGVAHAHQSGVLHLDIKPSNVLVDCSGRPRVIDFGIARASGMENTLTTENSRGVLGTIAYMSPEQWASARVDSRSDVWSLGVLICEMLCGRPPFEPGNGSLLDAVRARSDAGAPNIDRARLHRDLAAVLHKATAQDRARRYQSAGELANDLASFLAGEPVTARPPGVWTQVRQIVKRRPIGLTAAACLLLAGVTIPSTWLSVYVISRRPDHVLMDESKRYCYLRSIGGATAESWDSGAADGFLDCALVERPRSMGGGRLVLLAHKQHAAPPSDAGHVVALDADRREHALWTTRSIPLSCPPSIRRDTEFLNPDTTAFLVADCLPDVPGDEIVVAHNLSPIWATCLRVYDLAGAVRYEVWCNGVADELLWLSGSRQLVVSGFYGHERCDDRGEAVLGVAGYPRCVFAIRPVDGHVRDSGTIIEGQVIADPTIDWYKIVGPLEDLYAWTNMGDGVRPALGSWDRDRVVQYHIYTLEGEPDYDSRKILAFHIDQHGQELARRPSDSYRRAVSESEFPGDDRYRLMDPSEFFGAR